MTKTSKVLQLVAILIGCLFDASRAEQLENSIKIGVFPCTDVIMSVKKFQPLVTYLAQETGLKISLVIPKEPFEFERAIRNGDIDFAFQDPHVYVRVSDFFDKDMLLRARTRDGLITHAGVVITRKDSGIGSVHDLKGKTVMFGPKLSAARWLSARQLFEDNGLDINKDLKLYSHGGCCEDIAFSVCLKAVDAGVVCDHFLEEHSKRQEELGIDIDQIEIISKTGPVPTRVFACRIGIDSNIASMITDALLRLDNKNPKHKDLLWRAELGGFEKSCDEHYDSIRRLMSDN